MTLLDRERLVLLKNLSLKLADESLPDINLLLTESNLTTVPDNLWIETGWNNYEVTDDDRRQLLIDRLRELDTVRLLDFAQASSELLSLAIDTPALEGEPETLRVFASHRDGQKAHVHEVAEFLSELQISLFVAHDDIEPGEEWVDRIEQELRTAHAGTIFLVPGFETSTFCDQEVGWMRGREIPLYTLKYQTAFPYGFFGRKQAQHVPDQWKASRVAENIANWLSLQQEISGEFATSLSQSLQSAQSFDSANKRFSFIRDRKDLTSGQVASVAVSVRDNPQVSSADYRPEGKCVGEGLAHRILRFLKEQPGFIDNAGLLSEVAEAHGINDLGLIQKAEFADSPF